MEIDKTIALLAVLWALGVAIGLYLKSKRRSNPYVQYSDCASLHAGVVSWRERLIWLPTVLKVSALFLFLCAMADPRLVRQQMQPPPFSPLKPFAEHSQVDDEETKLPTEGVALYLVLDRSGSMQQQMGSVAVNGEKISASRIEVLKAVTAQFIQGNQRVGLHGRGNDMIGLVAFARVPHILTPLTLDHDALLEQLSKLSVVRYRQDDGTGIGYALFKTTHMILSTRHFSQELIKEGRPAYEIKSTAIVLVTDGLQNPNPLDKGHALRNIGLMDAAQYAAEQKVKVYIVNVEPAIRYPQYAAEREELQKAAELTGGRFYVADNPLVLQDIYKEIDILEKSVLPEEKSIQTEIRKKILHVDAPKPVRQFSFYPYLIAFGMITLLGGLMLENTLLKQVP
jgi:Ca-activated chloride channel family protein